MIKNTIEQDLIEAMKARDEIKLSVLRMLKSAIHNSEIQKQSASARQSSRDGTELKDEDVLGVIQSQIKQRQDSIELYEKGGRQELAQKEKAEIEILKTYLPEQMGEDEIREIIRKAIADTNAASIQDMGRVMGQIMPQVKGKADGSLVSNIVKEELS